MKKMRVGSWKLRAVALEPRVLFDAAAPVEVAAALSSEQNQEDASQRFLAPASDPWASNASDPSPTDRDPAASEQKTSLLDEPSFKTGIPVGANNAGTLDAPPDRRVSEVFESAEGNPLGSTLANPKDLTSAVSDGQADAVDAENSLKPADNNPANLKGIADIGAPPTQTSASAYAASSRAQASTLRAPLSAVLPISYATIPAVAQTSSDSVDTLDIVDSVAAAPASDGIDQSVGAGDVVVSADPSNANAISLPYRSTGCICPVCAGISASDWKSNSASGVPIAADSLADLMLRGLHDPLAAQTSSYMNDPDSIQPVDRTDTNTLLRSVSGRFQSLYSSSQALRTPLEITYSFGSGAMLSNSIVTSAASAGGFGTDGGTASSPSEIYRQYAREVFAEISSFSLVTFREVTATMDAQILLFEVSNRRSTVLSSGWAYVPSSNPLNALGQRPSSTYDGMLFVGNEVIQDSQRGERAKYVIAHEIGHVMGLNHPHGTESGKTLEQQQEDLTMEQSVMGYNLLSNGIANVKQIATATDNTGSVTSTSQSLERRHAQVFGMLDRYALQELYGVREEASPDNTQHVIAPSGIFSDVQGFVQDHAGANDRLDLSAIKGDSRVDMNRQSISDVDMKSNPTQVRGTYAFSEIFETQQSKNGKGIEDLYNGRKNLQIDDASDIEDYLGGSGRDDVTGNNLNNNIDGGPGDDTLRGGGGQDRLIGGEGIDAASYSDAAAPVTVNRQTNVHQGAAEGDTIDASTEGVVLSDHDDTYVAGGGNQYVVGGKGADRLTGGSGDDLLVGGDQDVARSGYGGVIGSIEPPETLAQGSRFGDRIITNGNIMLITAAGAKDGAGRVYTYERDVTTGVWRYTGSLAGEDGQKIDSGDAARGNLAAKAAFGQSIAMNGDYLVVGAPGENAKTSSSGKIYLYRYDPAVQSWVYKGAMSAAANMNQLGSALSLHRDAVNGNMVLTGVTFSSRSASSGDFSNYTILTIPLPASIESNFAGTRYTQFNLSTTYSLDTNTPAIHQGFGDRIVLSRTLSGEIIMLKISGVQLSGSTGSGISLRTEAVRSIIQEETDGQFGREVTADPSGKYFAISSRYSLSNDTRDANMSGHVEILYQDNVGQFRRDAIVLPPAADQSRSLNFGSTVAIYGDRLAIAADHDNTSQPDAVYLYQRTQDGEWDLQQKITHAPTASNAQKITLAFDGAGNLITRWTDGVVRVYEPNAAGSVSPSIASTYADNAKDIVDGGAGNDRLTLAVSDAETIQGGAGVDTAYVDRDLRRVLIQTDNRGLIFTDGTNQARADGVEVVQLKDYRLNVVEAGGISSADGMVVSSLPQFQAGARGIALLRSEFGGSSSNLGTWQIQQGGTGSWRAITIPSDASQTVFIAATDKIRFLETATNTAHILTSFVYRHVADTPTSRSLSSGATLRNTPDGTVDAKVNILKPGNRAPQGLFTFDPVAVTAGRLTNVLIQDVKTLFSDADGDTLTYSVVDAATNAPRTDVEFNPSENLLRVNFSTPQRTTLRVVATDPAGAQAFIELVINAEAGNAQPVAVSPPQDLIVPIGTTSANVIPANIFSDPENDALTWTLSTVDGSALPSWLTFDASTRTIQTSPALTTEAQTINLRISVTDGKDSRSEAVSQDFKLTLTSANLPPVVSRPLTAAVVGLNSPFSRTFESSLFSDPNGDRLTWTVTLRNGEPLPSWLTFNPITQTLSGTPTNPDDVKTFLLTVKATDPQGLSAEANFDLRVRQANRTPTVGQTIPNIGVIRDQTLSVVIDSNAFTDPDDDTLTWEVAAVSPNTLPSWLNFDPATRRLSGTAPATVQTVTIEISASDPSGAKVSQQVDIVVRESNRPPVVVGTDSLSYNARSGVAFNQILPANLFSDPDGDALTWSVRMRDGQALPAWLTFVADTRTLSGTPPDEAAAQTLNLTVVAADTTGANVSRDLILAVAQGNLAPSVTGTLNPLTARANTSLDYTIPLTTFDDDGGREALTWSLVHRNGQALPAWVRFNPLTRTIVGTPTATDVGRVPLTVRVTDTQGRTAETSLDLVVGAANQAPVATQEPLIASSLRVGDQFQYVISESTFRDAEGDPLTWSVRLQNGSALPSWLTFNPEGRALSGRPLTKQTVALTVSVTDPYGAVATRDLVLDVVDGSEAGVVLKTPITGQTIVAGDSTATIDLSNVFRLGSQVPGGTSIQVRVADAQGRMLPTWITHDAALQLLRLQPMSDALGDHTFRISGKIQGGQETFTNFTVRVVDDIAAIDVLDSARRTISVGDRWVLTSESVLELLKNRGTTKVPVVALEVDGAAPLVLERQLANGRWETLSGRITLSPTDSNIIAVRALAPTTSAAAFGTLRWTFIDSGKQVAMRIDVAAVEAWRGVDTVRTLGLTSTGDASETFVAVWPQLSTRESTNAASALVASLPRYGRLQIQSGQSGQAGQSGATWIDVATGQLIASGSVLRYVPFDSNSPRDDTFAWRPVGVEGRNVADGTAGLDATMHLSMVSSVAVNDLRIQTGTNLTAANVRAAVFGLTAQRDIDVIEVVSSSTGGVIVRDGAGATVFDGSSQRVSLRRLSVDEFAKLTFTLVESGRSASVNWRVIDDTGRASTNWARLTVLPATGTSPVAADGQWRSVSMTVVSDQLTLETLPWEQVINDGVARSGLQTITVSVSGGKLLLEGVTVTNGMVVPMDQLARMTLIRSSRTDTAVVSLSGADGRAATMTVSPQVEVNTASISVPLSGGNIPITGSRYALASGTWTTTRMTVISTTSAWSATWTLNSVEQTLGQGETVIQGLSTGQLRFRPLSSSRTPGLVGVVSLSNGRSTYQVSVYAA